MGYICPRKVCRLLPKNSALVTVLHFHPVPYQKNEKKVNVSRELQFESINYLLILHHFRMFIFSWRPDICCNAHIQQDLKKGTIFTEILFEHEKELKLIELREAVKTEKV